MKILIPITAIIALFASSVASSQPQKPTVLLVHGAFADTSSWNGVVRILRKNGYRVMAVANPLRGIAHDAEYLSDIVASLDGPIVLVGHSYGGLVITEVDSPKVKALVYVAAFAPDTGETAVGLSGKYPGSTLGAALAAPIALADGAMDLYIDDSKFHDQFAADVSAKDASLMAAGQRPVTEAALNEATSRTAWKAIPSWFIFGDEDKNIPPQAMAFMAERANSRQTEIVRGGSHVVMVSHPKAVAKMVERAAMAP